MKKLIYITAIAALLVSSTSCEKMLEFEQEGSLTTEQAIKTPEDLQATLNGAYDVFANTMNGNVQNFNELLSPNLNRPRSSEFYTEAWLHNTNIFNASVGDFYANAYRVIERANVLLINVDIIPELSASERQRMVAEAKFLRAYMHFELVKLFAQPYGYTADNSHLGIVLRAAGDYVVLPRSSVADVYAFVITDLNEAYQNLPAENGAYASKSAAAALLAKVHFQSMNYNEAVPYLNEVIDQGGFTLIDGVDRFREGELTSEHIFGVVSNASFGDDRSRPLKDNYTANDPELSITSEMIESTFGTLPDTSVDKRAKWFIISNPGLENERYILDKYPLNFFNVTLLHLTDMKLLRAEALAKTGSNLSQAVQDINDLRNRAGYSVLLPPTANVETILEAVYRERRIEMAGEGDWIQHLKRRGAEGENITIRGAIWSCPGMVLQFPSTENNEKFIMNPEGGC